MVLSETEWRQKELNKKIKKYKDGFYNDYYFEGENYLIVFVKHFKTSQRKYCTNIVGLDVELLMDIKD
jgi:ribosomal protein S6|tara:strand:- start:1918 stop:2121 length:204 start_codon:yes stop_codon:yes gene_type:complete